MNAAILRTDGLEHCRNIVGTQIELAINHPSLNLDSYPNFSTMSADGVCAFLAIYNTL